MQSKAAIEKYLKEVGGDGHGIYAPEKFLKMGFDQEFVERYSFVHESDGSLKGSIYDDNLRVLPEVKGVYALDFIDGIADDVGADKTEANRKMGRGFRAQCLVMAIRKSIESLKNGRCPKCKEDWEIMDTCDFCLGTGAAPAVIDAVDKLGGAE
jgi:hypothetical protein